MPPNIIEAETSQVAEVAEHSNVSLQCKASGHPRPTISWRREDGEPIRLTGSGDPPDGGPLRGDAAPREAGPGRDEQAEPAETRKRAAAASAAGERADVSATISRKCARPGSHPFKPNGAKANRRPPDRPPTSIPDLNDVRSDKLALTNVDRTMAGLYVCSASNGIPSQVSRQIPLYVKCK